MDTENTNNDKLTAGLCNCHRDYRGSSAPFRHASSPASLSYAVTDSAVDAVVNTLTLAPSKHEPAVAVSKRDRLSPIARYISTRAHNAGSRISPHIHTGSSKCQTRATSRSRTSPSLFRASQHPKPIHSDHAWRSRRCGSSSPRSSRLLPGQRGESYDR